MTSSNFDLEQARAKLGSGDWQYSIRDADYVAALRALAGQGHTGSEIANKLSTSRKTLSRSMVISLCHRVKPPISLLGMSGGSPAAAEKAWKTKREQPRRRSSPDTLSTHHVRLQRAVAAKHPKPLSERSLLNPNVKANGVEPAPTVVRRYQPRCTWFGCDALPMRPGRPYCTAHHQMSGALFR